MQTWLSDRGIPVPIGASADQWPPDQLPVANQLVLKPADGCGGQGLQILPAPLTQQEILTALNTSPKRKRVNQQEQQLLRDQQLLRQWRVEEYIDCLLYTSPSPRDRQKSRMPSSA